MVSWSVLGFAICAWSLSIAGDAVPLAVQVASVRPDKVLYEPGQTGEIEVVVKNTSRRTVAGALRIVLESALEQQRVLQEEPMCLEQGEKRTFTIPFTAEG